MVQVEDICPKGHKSKRRCSKDPKGLPCKPCEREAAAVKHEAERHAEAKAARERNREAATARLAEARRTAALEREKLAHERELMRLEKETQRAEIDAERTRSSQKSARTSLEGARTAAGAGASSASAPAPAFAAPDTKRGRKTEAAAATTAKGKGKGKDTTQELAAATASGTSSAAQKVGAKAGKHNRGIISPTTAKGSILLLIAEAADRGDARGITNALQAVPSGKEREQTCHALTVAIGDSAYDWFARGSGGEPSPVGPPTQRTVQALGLIASGEWVKARTILAAIVKDTTAKKQRANDGSDPPVEKSAKQVDPAAVYALALCNHQIAGGSGGAGSTAAKKLLDELAAAELELWPGPPESRPPPDARAFPLGGLVRAHLLAASATPSSPQQEGPDGERGTASAPNQDPKAQACSLAVAFLRAPAHALKVGNVNSPAWTAAAEALVGENGGSLARELWGPGGGPSGDDGGKDGNSEGGSSSGDGGGGDGGGGDNEGGRGDGVKAEWNGLQAKWGVSSEGMDSLLDLSGLDAIKAEFLRTAKLTIINKERGYDPASGSFNIRLEGNPGTGGKRKANAEHSNSMLYMRQHGSFV